MGFLIEVRPPELAGTAGVLWGHAQDAQSTVRATSHPLAGGGTGNAQCDGAFASFHAMWVEGDLRSAVKQLERIAENLMAAAERYTKADDCSMQSR